MLCVQMKKEKANGRKGEESEDSDSDDGVDDPITDVEEEELEEQEEVARGPFPCTSQLNFLLLFFWSVYRPCFLRWPHTRFHARSPVSN